MCFFKDLCPTKWDTSGMFSVDRSNFIWTSGCTDFSAITSGDRDNAPITTARSATTFDRVKAKVLISPANRRQFELPMQ
jgi:hypothetical protein